MSGFSHQATATAYAPGSIGNVGPGFDVLGLAFDGLGDTVTVTVAADDEPSRITGVTGRDAERIPRDASNTALIAARAYFDARGFERPISVSIDKGLPLSAGLGGSAASSVAGAFAAHLLAVDLGIVPADRDAARDEILAAALAGEASASGRHLDNLGPSLLGGLVLSRSVEPIDVVPLPVAAPWWLALWTPEVRIETRAARAILPATSDRDDWVQQMANTAALVHAFTSGDGALLARALDDRFAEPRRASLIPRFHEVKAAARVAGAFGGSISGSGPTVFAVAPDERTARACADAMTRAGEVASTARAAAIARQGARRA
jgi:homoserine kinase